jgi:hypothetical protein
MSGVLSRRDVRLLLGAAGVVAVAAAAATEAATRLAFGLGRPVKGSPETEDPPGPPGGTKAPAG